MADATMAVVADPEPGHHDAGIFLLTRNDFKYHFNDTTTN
jgi:hypothetical protein